VGDVVFPSSIDDFTPAYVEGLLRHAGLDVTVDAIDIQPLGEGVGLVGQLLRIELQGSGDLPPAIIAKFPSPYEATKDLAQFYGFFRSEADCYRAARTHDFGVRMAKCYLAEVSADNRDTIVVLEDLSHLRAGDQIVGASLSDAELIIDAAAALHARWWNSAELQQANWMRPLDNPAYLAAQEHFEQSLPVFAEMYDGRLAPGSLAIAQAHGPTIRDMLLWTVAERPLTLTHFDFRLDNFLFDDDHAGTLDGVVVIDWQLTVQSTGMTDVSYFLVQSLTLDDRRQHCESLLRRWHEGLLSHGVTDYTWDDVMTDFRIGVLGQLSIPVVSAANLDPGNERGRQLVDTLVQRNFQALVDYDCGKVIHGS
jgi:Ecdysteroid kinase-like family